MSDNLMDMVKGAVSNQVMGQIGGLLGVDQKKTSGLFENAAGAILGGLMKKSGSEQGARDVFDMVKKSDDGILDKLGDLLGGGKEEEFMKSGGGILDGIMGGDKSSMVGMIAKALGLDSGMVSKLMMMAAPIIMGVVGRYVKNKGLDMIGLKGLLGSQGPNISGALPAGLGSQLGLGNLVSNVTGGVGDAAGAVGGLAKSATGAVGNVAGAAVDGGNNLMKMLIPFILIIGLILAGIFILPQIMGGGLLGGGTEVTSENLEEITDGFQTKMDGVAKAIDEITDIESAKIAGPKLTEFSSHLSGLNFSGITPEQMQPLKSKLQIPMTMNEGLKKAYGIEGVKDYLKPIFDKLMAAIDAVMGSKG